MRCDREPWQQLARISKATKSHFVIDASLFVRLRWDSLSIGTECDGATTKHFHAAAAQTGRMIVQPAGSPRVLDVADKRVLVTAGASDVGRAISGTAVSAGASVHITDVARTAVDEVSAKTSGPSTPMSSNCEVRTPLDPHGARRRQNAATLMRRSQRPCVAGRGHIWSGRRSKA